MKTKLREIVILAGLFVLLALLFPVPGWAKSSGKGRLLYLTLTKGYHHESIELSKQVIQEVGERSGAWDTTVTEDVGDFSRENLKRFDAVMFNTTGELPMSDGQKAAFADFIRSGHGFIGVHSATDTFYKWGTYLDIIGGYFNGHPWHEMVTIDVVDPKSPIVGFLGGSFQINDEIYQVSDFKSETSHVLLQLDPDAANMKKPGIQIRPYGWPVAWTRSYGKGRVYYNGLGHDDWVWKDERFQKMLLNGIKWAMHLP